MYLLLSPLGPAPVSFSSSSSLTIPDLVSSSISMFSIISSILPGQGVIVKVISGWLHGTKITQSTIVLVLPYTFAQVFPFWCIIIVNIFLIWSNSSILKIIFYKCLLFLLKLLYHQCHCFLWRLWNHVSITHLLIPCNCTASRRHTPHLWHVSYGGRRLGSWASMISSWRLLRSSWCHWRQWILETTLSVTIVVCVANRSTNSFTISSQIHLLLIMYYFFKSTSLVKDYPFSIQKLNRLFLLKSLCVGYPTAL